MAVPKTDLELLQFASNMSARISSAPGDYAVTAEQAALLAARTAAYEAAYNALVAARESGVRSSPLAASKTSAKLDLLEISRELYALVNDSKNVSESRKRELGIQARRAWSQTPAPAEAPAVQIVSVIGRTVRLSLRDAQATGRRARPAGTIGAVIVSCVSNETPTASANWRYEGQTAGGFAEVQFPETVPAGAQVWVAASWFSFRKLNGPFSTPVSTNLQGGAQAAG